MTPKERMLAALEGRQPDRLPVAPYFWGEEYVWRLVGRPVWQLSLGPPETVREIIAAIQARHDADWVIPLAGGSNFLAGKQVDDSAGRVLITDPATGERWEYLMEGRRLVGLDAEGNPLAEQARTTARLHSPITTMQAAREWLAVQGRLEEGPEPPLPTGPDWLVQGYGDRYLTVGCAGGGFHQLCYPLGLEPALVMLKEALRVAAWLLERLMAGIPRRARELAAMGYDAGFVVDSYASADIISPRDYADWIAPIHRAHARALREAGLKSIFYNTGNCLPLLDTMRTLGFDALTFEERNKGVEQDLALIRRALGPGICLFANFDSYLLLRGDRQAIAAEVRQLTRAGAGGGLVMSTGSPICDATDPAVVDWWLGVCRGQQDRGQTPSLRERRG